jgi:hypothetical protein
MSLTSYTFRYKLVLVSVVISMAAPFAMPPSSPLGSAMRASGVDLDFGFLKNLLPSGILGAMLKDGLDSSEVVSTTITAYEGRISSIGGKIDRYCLQDIRDNGIATERAIAALAVKVETEMAGLHTEMAGLHTEMTGLHKGMTKVKDGMKSLRVAVEKLAPAPAPKGWWKM